MPSFKSAAALAAMVGVALATPIEKRGTFSLKQVQKGTYLKNGPASVVKTFNKYGKEAPSEVKAAAAAAATGEVTTEPGDEYDSLYLTPVTVGSVEMELDIDTGSADLWVFSTLLSSSEQSGHAVYDPTVSGTKLSGYTWCVQSPPPVIHFLPTNLQEHHVRRWQWRQGHRVRRQGCCRRCHGHLPSS